MTISSTTVKNSYSGDGSTTTFNYTFKIFADSDLQVIIRSAAGTETVKTITTHYTVSGAGDANGGSVTFTSGNIPTATETVLLRRAVPQTQAIDYIANDPFPAESHEAGLDRATMTTQQIQEELDRAIKLSRTNTMTSTEFTTSATDRASKILAFDASGEISVTQELGTFKGTDATVTTEAYVQRDIIKSTTAGQLNNVYICVADSVVGDSLTDTDHFELLVDAVSAATSATNAAASATTATTKASEAATSASNASTSASTASTQATNAANSATAAATSAAEAAASADNFDDTYLGSKSSDPSVDNDGDALNAGDLYFNTTSNTLKVYNGSSWQDAALTSSDFVSVSEFKNGGTNFANSLIVGHSTTGTLNTAEFNTAVGKNSLKSVTTADFNAFVGYDSAQAITSGGYSVALGANSLRTATGANFNSAIGYDSLRNATGSGNSGLGKDAGKSISTGENNLCLGFGAGDNLTSGSGNVIIGSLDADSATDSRQLKIAGYDGLTTTTWITGGNDGVVTLNAANVSQQALTSSSNAVAWDASAKPNAYHLTTENTTFAAPTNAVEGAFICLEINYDGAHTIAFNTVFEFAASTAPTFTSTDGKTDILVFRYSGSVWQEVGRTLNLSES